MLLGRTTGMSGAQPHTYIRDCTGRLIAVRTSHPRWMPGLMVRIGPKVVKFVSLTRVSDAERLKNNRGHHYASNFGADQQNKTVCTVFYLRLPHTDVLPRPSYALGSITITLLHSSSVGMKISKP